MRVSVPLFALVLALGCDSKNDESEDDDSSDDGPPYGEPGAPPDACQTNEDCAWESMVCYSRTDIYEGGSYGSNVCGLCLGLDAWCGGEWVTCLSHQSCCPGWRCDDGTCEPSDGSRPTCPGQCYEEPPVVLDPGETSPLGFSGEDLFESILGEFATELTFVDVPFLAAWVRGTTYAPTLTLSWTDGAIRYVRGGAEDPECEGHVEVNMELSLLTAEGSFDEVRPVVLEARELTTGTFFLELFPPELSGTFDVAGMTDPSTEVSTLNLIGTVSDRKVSGSLMLTAWNTEVGSFGQVVADWRSVDP